MNERFEDLMYKAGLTAQGCWDNLDEYDRGAIEKFAELIVQDCISQIAMIGVSNCENNDVGWTVDKSIENIRKHFGVEE